MAQKLGFRMVFPQPTFSIKVCVLQSTEWTVPVIPMAVYCMLGSRNYRRGGGGVVQVSLTFFARFQRSSNIFQGGPTFFRGGGGFNCLFPIETHITCDFQGGGPDPLPPSGSALVLIAVKTTW